MTTASSKELQFQASGKVIIEHDVWIGRNVTIVPNVTIHTGAAVSPGSVIVDNVPAYAIMAGNPAQCMRYRVSVPARQRLLQSQWWNLTREQLRPFAAALASSDETVMTRFADDIIDKFVQPSYTLSVLAIIRNERGMLKEWMDHYMNEGVDHFYLIHDGTLTGFDDILHPYVQLRHVTVWTDTTIRGDEELYNMYMMPVKHETKWLIVCDAEDYMFGTDTSIKHHLEAQLQSGCMEIQVQCKLFETCTRNVVRSSIRRKRVDGSLGTVKTILLTKMLIKIGVHSSSTVSHHQNLRALYTKLTEPDLKYMPIQLNSYALTDAIAGSDVVEDLQLQQKCAFMMAAADPYAHDLTTFSSCIPEHACVYVHPAVDYLFDEPIVLLKRWLSNAGHTVTASPDCCSMQICIQRCVPVTGIPYIIVACEQPAFFNSRTEKSLYQNAAFIWCMDNVDIKFYTSSWNIHPRKMRIIPTMFGTYYSKYVARSLKEIPQYDVVQYGGMHSRRAAVMNGICALRPGTSTLYTVSLVHVQGIADVVSRCKVVVIPSLYAPPNTFGIHRLAFLLRIPNIVIVVEECPESVFLKQFVDFTGRIIVVPYANLAETVVYALNFNSSVHTPVRVLDFANKLWNWDGKTPWNALSIIDHVYDAHEPVPGTWMHDYIHMLTHESLQTVDAVIDIPRILHVIWVGGDNSIPTFLEAHMLRWRELMPDWQVNLWGEDEITDDHFPEEALQRIRACNKGAQKADIMRYYILERYGGVYVDADVIPHRNLDEVLKGPIVLCHDLDITWQYINIAFMAAVPHHPVIQRACELLLQCTINTGDVHMQTGPRVLGMAVSQTPPAEGTQYNFLPAEYFYRNEWFDRRFGLHLFSKMW